MGCLKLHKTGVFVYETTVKGGAFLSTTKLRCLAVERIIKLLGQKGKFGFTISFYEIQPTLFDNDVDIVVRGSVRNAKGAEQD